MFLLILVLSMVKVSIITGIGEGMRIIEPSQKNKEYKNHLNSMWHKLQLLERLGFLITGGFIFIFTHHNVILLISFILLFSAIFWIIYDGIIRIYQKKPFFYTAVNKNIITTYFDKWYIKIFYLCLTIFLTIYFY